MPFYWSERVFERTIEWPENWDALAPPPKVIKAPIKYMWQKLYTLIKGFRSTRFKITLTLNVRGPSYLALTRSISWLLMTWLLTSRGHQQPWYWPCKICSFLSSLRKDFNYLRFINVEKCKYMFMFPLKNLARKGLRTLEHTQTATCHPDGCRCPGAK